MTMLQSISVGYNGIMREHFTTGFLILDVETTGFLPEGEVIQVSVYDSEGAERLTTYVKPSKPIDEAGRAFAINGITQAMVEEAPPFAEVHPILCKLLGERRVFAYNAPFDRGLIEAECKHLELPPPTCQWECAMRTYLNAIGDTRRGIKLVTACADRGIEVAETHEAGADVRLTLELLRRLAA